eukprot:TRINITY_DN1571_c0_g1_i10.p1 TRINITY_DN1571_c0_g1~~TRINITY_DN1571_c0_g1_i10.p1  ORF type:complete len:184 (+),score=30.06 TRINITY_DN1571_c0_g1_i10:540-1091(+)
MLFFSSEVPRRTFDITVKVPLRDQILLFLAISRSTTINKWLPPEKRHFLEQTIVSAASSQQYVPRAIWKPFLDDRNKYMASNLRDLKNYKTVVAVMGAAHVQDVAKFINVPESDEKKFREELLVVPTMPANNNRNSVGLMGFAFTLIGFSVLYATNQNRPTNRPTNQPTNQPITLTQVNFNGT